MEVDGNGGAGPSTTAAAVGIVGYARRGGEGAGPSQLPHRPKKTESDEEMENELAASIGRAGEDPMAAYDVAVEEEGAAIELYMALLNSG
jgi:hypothetical protein